MKRQNRIRKNQDFKNIISKHHMIRTNEYVVYIDHNRLGYARVGVSVSSKLGNAIVRNRIKRQIKAILHDIVNLDKNNDIVIIAQEAFKQNSYQQNFDSLQKIIKELQ